MPRDFHDDENPANNELEPIEDDELDQETDPGEDDEEEDDDTFWNAGIDEG